MVTYGIEPHTHHPMESAYNEVPVVKARELISYIGGNSLKALY